MKYYNEIDKELLPYAKPMSFILGNMISSKIGSTLLNKLMSKQFYKFKEDQEMCHSVLNINYNFNSVEIRHAYNSNIKDINTPVIFYIHGGAFLLDAVEYQYNLACQYAKETGSKLVFIRYTTANKKSYPQPLKDCYDVINYFYDHSEKYNMDNRKFIVMGDSAGGCLTASVTNLCIDHNINILSQLLIYPTLIDKSNYGSMKKYRVCAGWSGKYTKKVWKIYLGHNNKHGSKYAIPLLFDDLGKTPNTYIEYNEVDPLKDESLEFAKKLRMHHVDLHLYKNAGCFHGFDINTELDITKNIVKRRINYINEILSR